jgi:integrase
MEGGRLMARKQTNIRQRGSSWVVSFRLDGGQVWRSFKTKDEAELYLAEVQLQRARGERVAVPSKVRFDDFAKEWLASHPGVDPRTRELYDQRIRDYLNPVLGRLKLAEIDGDDVRRVKERAARLGRSGWTQKGILSLLSGILSYAVDRKQIGHNPVATLSKRDRPKSREGGRGPKRILTSDELRTLLGNAGRFRVLVAVAVYGGLRLSEVLALVWDDVDFEQGAIHVRAQLSVPNKYDTAPPHRVALKSDSDEGCERWVFLADDLVKLLKEHRGDRIVRRDAFVFTTGAGTPFTQRNIGRAFDDMLEAAGFEWMTRCGCGEWEFFGPATAARDAKREHLEKAHAAEDVSRWEWSTEDKPTFHSLRHTFASAIIAGGADQGHLARLLGHTDPAFTYRTYVHEFDKQARQAESKAALGAAFAGVLA